MKIKVEGLNAGYGQHHILKDVSLEIPLRGTTAILGPGGSGKSTLVRAIGGWDGAGFWARTVRQSPAGDWACQWQNPGHQTRQRLRRLLEGHPSPADALRQLWSEISEASAFLYHALYCKGGEKKKDDPPWMERLMAFTLILASHADFAILDEPDLDLPELARHWVIRRIRTLGQQRPTLLVTHNLSIAREVADFILLLDAGVIIGQDTSERFFATPQGDRARSFLMMGS